MPRYLIPKRQASPFSLFTEGTAGVNSTYVKVTDAASLRRTTEFTCAAWVMVPGTSTINSYSIIGKGLDTYTTYNYLLAANSGVSWDKFLFATYNGTSNPYIISNTSGTPNTWYFICGVISNGYLDIYVNGIKDAISVLNTASLEGGTSNLFIGVKPNGTAAHEGPFKGNLKDIRIYQRALSAIEIKDMYNGIDPVSDSLSAQWKFEKNTLDSSGNSNNGTIVGTSFSYGTAIPDVFKYSQRVKIN